jgi:hypothetical protein
LFRGHKDTSVDDCMFFATKHWVAGAFNDTIQVWKTKSDIQILFLVDYLNDNSWSISALPQLFNSIFPADSNSNFGDLDIKRMDINRRNKLVQKLFDEFKISGWLTSLENRVEIEVCLFDKQANTNQLQLFDTVDNKNKNYFKDSLDRIKILPTKTFYDKTNQKLLEHTNFLSADNEHYKSYKRNINAWIKHEVQNGMNKVEAKHYFLNLRTKLKI